MQIRLRNANPSSFTHFVQNYHMMKWDKSLEELQGMLKTYETDSKKHKPQAQVLAVTDKKIDKNKKKKGNKKRKDKKGNGKFSDEGSDKSKTHPDSECFYCKSKGHWKRNCRKYLQDKKSGASTSGISKSLTNLSICIYDIILIFVFPWYRCTGLMDYERTSSHWIRESKTFTFV